MSERSAIVLVIDGLGAAHLGPYGNSWVGTAGLDSFAAESLVIEHAIADSPSLAKTYRSYWQGRHAMCPDGNEPSLAALCKSHAVQPMLITDAARVADHGLAADFLTQRVPINLQADLAEAPESTHSARFAESIVSAMDKLQPPFCLWIHAMGLSGPWDCPYELRLNFVDPEVDPDPPRASIPPQFESGGVDPDVVWGYQVAHAAQVSLIDASLAFLFDTIRALSIDYDLLTLLTSPRGYPLGEHEFVGYSPASLHAEQVHVPMIVRANSQLESPLRTQSIAQPADVFGTLDAWFGFGANRGSTGAGDLLRSLDGQRHWHSAGMTASGMQGFRTAGWNLLSTADPEGAEGSSLYVKPDDRLEVNEVSRRLPDLVDRMSAAMTEYQNAAQSSALDQLAELDGSLREAQV